MNPARRIVLSLLLAAAVGCAGSLEGDREDAMNAKQKPEDRKFFEVRLGSSEPADCSPEFGEDEQGFRIAAPEVVTLGGDFSIPICAAARFDADVRDRLPAELWDAMVIVAVDSLRNRVHEGRLADASPIPTDKIIPVPPPDPDKIDPDKRVVVPESEAGDVELTSFQMTEYRNFELLSNVDLPEEPAVYTVFLTYGEHQSNSVRIEVRRPGGGRE